MKEERVCCSCGHKEGEHKRGTFSFYRRPTQKKFAVDGSMTDITLKEPIGCTRCSCIAFRLEEARLLR